MLTLTLRGGGSHPSRECAEGVYFKEGELYVLRGKGILSAARRLRCYQYCTKLRNLIPKALCFTRAESYMEGSHQTPSATNGRRTKELYNS